MISLLIFAAVVMNARTLTCDAFLVIHRRNVSLLNCYSYRDIRQFASVKGSDNDHIRLQQHLKKAEDAAFKRFVKNEAPQWMKKMDHGFPFSCTGCGKCCKTKGEVYLCPDDVQAAASLLQLSTSDFTAKYASHTLSHKTTFKASPFSLTEKPWVRLKSAVKHEESKDFDVATKQSSPSLDACIFLDINTNQCQSYEARPTQCRTYPFWPPIMKSIETWNEECCRPDHSAHDENLSDIFKELPIWTPEDGGCEGMQLIDKADQNKHSEIMNQLYEGTEVETVQQNIAYRQLYKHTSFDRLFPTESEVPVK